MSPMLDVSDDVRAEIGEEEVAKLLAGETAPSSYDCTSCRTPGDTGQERTSTVLFVGEETAVLAFAHANCVPSQIVRVTEEQIQGAVRTITGDSGGAPGADGEQAVLKVTCGQVLIDEQLRAAIVVEPNGAIARPGSEGTTDEFLPLLMEHGFTAVTDLETMPAAIPGWSVLMAAGQLHAVLQPGPEGNPSDSWWQAHQPLPVTDEWRATANRTSTVLVFAVPSGGLGEQPREDLMRQALEKAAANGYLVAAAMPLAGT
ncbi:hypothetical protein [Streptomyces alkaliterrae]|uniref:Uncharacterized protein n=1 Tax=Streptomyces alkaliterrae TaxID=2213162 RepID=A0A5P0YYK8_9ACTN|nr:hypothetical protein [Streptomyces alkaliterrae]MBB1254704.1 hypothetical protein [Streptomyces alkaliterrae]MBB1258022.1 hypothetical protein [Streptomyces alkaliterrae]MQS04617.1 hypothetical protein [Streptomyces alkaliterrae]